MLNLEPWLAHLHAQLFCLIAAGYGTPVVIAENDDRAPNQTGPEDAFRTFLNDANY
jgi:hypothetical protein